MISMVCILIATIYVLIAMVYVSDTVLSVLHALGMRLTVQLAK